jgi:hypothetical protein
MGREYPELPWCRYADDGLVHCRTLEEAEAVKASLQKRLAECHLEMHPTKTKIVYCKDGKRKDEYADTSFDFLGYSFQRRRVEKRRDKSLFVSFTPAVSKKALNAMREKIRALKFRHRTQTELSTISRTINPMIQGWMNYYGCYRRSELEPLYRYINQTLVAWAMRKFKRLRGNRRSGRSLIANICKKCPRLFIHWQYTTMGAFA